MKKYIFLAIAAFTLLFVSCQKNELMSTEPSSFELVANIAKTKTTLSEDYKVEWEDGDIIYMVTSDETWGAAGSQENPAMESIAEFVYSSGKFTTESQIAPGEYTFNALYARADQKTYHRGKSNSHKLEAVQVQDCANPTAEVKKNDALVGTFEAKVPMTKPAEVNMQHLYTLMRVDIKNATGASVEVKSFEMTAAGADLAAIFNVVAFDTPSLTTKQDASETITVNLAGGTVDNDASLPVYFVMAPLSNYSGDVTFKVTDSANKTYTKTVKMSGISFEAGHYNTTPYTISVADAVEPEPETSSVTWDLTKESYQSASTDQVVWSSDFVNLTLEKGGSSTAANNHLADEHSRVYKDQIMTFDPLGMYQIESIEFAVVSEYDDEFEKATWVNGEPVTSGNTVVVTPTDGHAKVSATLGAATRFTSITVYYSYDENFVLPTVESIAVDGQISELMQGSEFVFGGTVTATYSNAETADVTSAAKFSGYDMSASGEQTVEVSYTEGEKTVKTSYQLTILPADADVIDKLNLALTGQSGTTYGVWSGKKVSSAAEYAGNSAGGNNSIQMRSDKSSSGIVTTTSGGYAKKVVLTWQSETADGRTLNIYGKNTAYTAATDLYDSAKQGTLLGTIKKGTSTEFVIPGNYQYIGLRSASGAMYISEIQITWSSSPIALESIAVSGQKEEYYVGDSFEEPTVTATYSDGSSSVVSGAVFSGYDMSQEGEQTVTVSYTQGDVTKETTYIINVKAKPALASIVIDGTPKTEYTVGETFVAPSVKATYSDGLKETVAAKFSGYDMSKEGEQTVKVSYTEGDITAETTYKIVVKAAPSGPVEKSATLSFANKAQRTSFSTTQQVWEQNGIMFTNDKASSSNNVADYAAPVRLYANSKVTVSAPGNISKIVFDCNSGSYATAIKNSIGTVSGATVTVSSDKVTVTIASPNAASFVVAKLSAQVRLDSITVTYLQ